MEGGDHNIPSVLIINEMILILKLLISLFWVENVSPLPKASEYDQELTQPNTADLAPSQGTVRKSHRTITRHHKDKKVKQPPFSSPSR